MKTSSVILKKKINSPLRPKAAPIKHGKKGIDLLAAEKVHHGIVLLLFFLVLLYSHRPRLDALSGNFIAIVVVVGGDGSTYIFERVLRRGGGGFGLFAGGGVGVHV
jgi:hypothetical protein